MFSLEMRLVLLLDINFIFDHFSQTNQLLESIVKSCWYNQVEMEQWILKVVDVIPRQSLKFRIEENSNLDSKFKQKIISFLNLLNQ